eukprot:TRINITY_DN34625_c0_g1_i1.p1 TRINITY_DN34625_c0_g1~~TRINITY_DN34625_c0_g1_i1.p1  ORF type:complete len:416 (-),score=58.59 TRINITY_DN34625_c0_g1_i1:144-1391(-)
MTIALSGTRDPSAVADVACEDLVPSATPCPFPFVDHIWTVFNTPKGPAPSVQEFSNLAGWNLLGGTFDPGESVAVDLKSNAKHCHCVVLGESDDPVTESASNEIVIADSDVVSEVLLSVDELQLAVMRRRSLWEQRRRASHRQAFDVSRSGNCAESSLRCVRVLGESDPEKSILRVPVHRMVRVLPSMPARVLLVADTTSYRRLAKTQVGRGDAVLEVGSSLGDCTHILHSHAGVVVGIDISERHIEVSRGRYPHCRFEWLDCFEEPARLQALCADLQARGVLKIFVDVGGDRVAEDVCHVLSTLGGATGTSSALVVVKARSLVASAKPSCDASGTVSDGGAWWQRAAVRPVRSALQTKKKLGRAHKARWSAVDEEGEEWDAFRKQCSMWDNPDEYRRLKESIRLRKEATNKNQT